MSSDAIAKRVLRRTAHHRKNLLVQPFLKWAGGKRQLLPEIRQYIPKTYSIYFEPFLGAAAVLFDEQPPHAIINDANDELVNCYRVIKNNPEELIQDIQRHLNTKEYFYQLRAQDREPNYKDLPPIERASRIIFLNKTCFNGLFRVNSQGQFNVPFGDYNEPTIVKAAVVKAVSHYLNDNSIEICSGDFAEAVSGARRGDFIYFDPPYDPLSDTSSFTGYNLYNFDKEEQRRLKSVCDTLTHRGCKVLVSNSATDFIRNLYSDTQLYTICEVEASRAINSVATGRGKISELLIFNNYDVE